MAAYQVGQRVKVLAHPINIGGTIIDDREWHGTIASIEEAPALFQPGTLLLYAIVPDGKNRPEPGISEHRVTLPSPGE